jgi:hypothetical protein
MKRWRLDTANWSNHKGLGRFGCHLLKQIPCARMFRYRSQEESLDELTEVYHWVRLVLYRSSFDLEIWVKLLSMYIRFSSGVPTDPRLLVNIRTIVNVKSNRYNSHFYSPVKIYRNMIMTLRTHMLALITGTVSEIFNSSQQHWLLLASQYNFICTLVILWWAPMMVGVLSAALGEVRFRKKNRAITIPRGQRRTMCSFFFKKKART